MRVVDVIKLEESWLQGWNAPGLYNISITTSSDLFRAFLAIFPLLPIDLLCDLCGGSRTWFRFLVFIRWKTELEK